VTTGVDIAAHTRRRRYELKPLADQTRVRFELVAVADACAPHLGGPVIDSDTYGHRRPGGARDRRPQALVLSFTA
jgi:hypothetical protein